MRITRAFPVVVSGPSGAGKTTLITKLVEGDPLLCESISTTTRAPRAGEVEGHDYFFVDDKEFVRLKKAHLVEWAQVHDHFYGTPKSFVEQELTDGRDVVLNIDVQGGASVKKVFPETVLIFILPPSFATLEERIRKRGTDFAKEIDKRLENARWEITFAKDYDYLVENDTVENAVERLHAIIKSERCRRSRYPDGFTETFK